VALWRLLRNLANPRLVPEVEMTRRLLVSLALIACSIACLAAANGKWLERVPPADHQRANPYAGQPDAVAAGKNLYATNCAKCHGANAEGKG
jgi:mono/diheme cytochrome c family protein